VSGDKLLDRLRAGNLTLLVEREGRLAFASDRTSLKPLFRGVLEHPEIFEGADVADRVVGLAAAYLLTHAKIRRVVATVISREAEKALDDAGIEHSAEQRVKTLQDPPFADGIGLEKMARDAGSPQRFLEILRLKMTA
jgi:hypothetical protein